MFATDVDLIVETDPIKLLALAEVTKQPKRRTVQFKTHPVPTMEAVILVLMVTQDLFGALDDDHTNASQLQKELTAWTRAMEEHKFQLISIKFGMRT